MITSKKMPQIKNSVIVLDDMGDKLKKDTTYYFTEGRHHNIQMIEMCQKPAQIFKTARMSCDTVYFTTYNGADLFKSFLLKYINVNMNFFEHEIINDLNCN